MKNNTRKFSRAKTPERIKKQKMAIITYYANKRKNEKSDKKN